VQQAIEPRPLDGIEGRAPCEALDGETLLLITHNAVAEYHDGRN
jgi:hypothetical protein